MSPIYECNSHQMHLPAQLTRSSWAPTISRDSHQNIIDYGAGVDVVLLTYSRQREDHNNLYRSSTVFEPVLAVHNRIIIVNLFVGESITGKSTAWRCSRKYNTSAFVVRAFVIARYCSARFCPARFCYCALLSARFSLRGFVLRAFVGSPCSTVSVSFCEVCCLYSVAMMLTIHFNLQTSAARTTGQTDRCGSKKKATRAAVAAWSLVEKRNSATPRGQGTWGKMRDRRYNAGQFHSDVKWDIQIESLIH